MDISEFFFNVCQDVSAIVNVVSSYPLYILHYTSVIAMTNILFSVIFSTVRKEVFLPR